MMKNVLGDGGQYGASQSTKEPCRLDGSWVESKVRLPTGRTKSAQRVRENMRLSGTRA